MTRTLHVAVIPDSVRLPVALVHLTGTQIDDLAILDWLHDPEQRWSIGYHADAQVPLNVRATLLARTAGTAAGTAAFIAGPVVVTGPGPEQLTDVTADAVASVSRFN